MYWFPEVWKSEWSPWESLSRKFMVTRVAGVKEVVEEVYARFLVGRP